MLKPWNTIRGLLVVVVILYFAVYPSIVVADSAAVSEVDIKEAEKLFGSGPQEEDYWRIDELLLTATGSQVPVFKAPSVASLITKEDIEAMGATTLDEVLQTVPGLHVYPSGLGLFNSLYPIRGINSGLNPQTLVLINGIPVSQAYNGTRPWGFKMPVAMISRVEVVRGPGSAVHGADAFAGVINVITKDNFEIDGTEVGARYGSFNSFDTWLQHGGQYSGWDVWGTIELQRTDGDEDRVIKKDYMDAIGLSAFSNTPGYIDTEYMVTTTQLGVRKGDFTSRLHGTLIDSAMGPGGLQAITYGNEIDGKQLLSEFEWRDKDLTADWDLGVRLYYFYLDTDQYYELLPNDFRNMIGNPIVKEQHSGIETTAFFKGINRHEIRLSGGAKYYDVQTESNKNFGPGVQVQFGELVAVGDTPYVFMEDQNRTLFFGSVQDEWYVTRDLTFTGGCRIDTYSDFGTTINPRAALVWEVDYYLTTKLLYGRAFRSPSFAQQHVQNNPVLKGNPDAEPETIDTFELVFDLQPTKDIHAVLSLFTYVITDQLDVVEVEGSLPLTDNVGEQEGSGFEIEMDWKPVAEFRLESYFAYQRSKNQVTGNLISDVPEMQFYLNPHYEFNQNWSLDGGYYWIGGVRRQAGDPRGDIDDYGLVNLTLRKKNIIKNFDAALSVRNLLDENGVTPSIYEPNAPEGAYIPGDYPIEGRSVWAELRYRF